MKLLNSKLAWLVFAVVLLVLALVGVLEFTHWMGAACPGSTPCD
jgi:hypothetical protein